jgi:hypothetical protein
VEQINGFERGIDKAVEAIVADLQNKQSSRK